MVPYLYVKDEIDGHVSAERNFSLENYRQTKDFIEADRHRRLQMRNMVMVGYILSITFLGF